MLITVLWYILIGAIIGALARLLVPGKNPIGIILTILVGVAGAIVGGVIASALGAGDVIAFILAIVIAAVGVVLLTGARGGGWGGRRWGGRRHRDRVM